MILFTVLISIASSIAEAYFDAKKKVINHSISAFVRLTSAVGISYYLFFHPYYISLYSVILLVIYTIVFDPFYNVFKGMKVWYIGNTAVTDKLARKYIGKDGFTYLVFKVVFLFACLFMFEIGYLFVGF